MRIDFMERLKQIKWISNSLDGSVVRFDALSMCRVAAEYQGEMSERIQFPELAIPSNGFPLETRGVVETKN